MLGPLTSSSMQGVEPVLRTYNTLIIACNMCNQPREAMAVYKRMLDEGYTPNATTYNALISAHGKAGQLDKVICSFPIKHSRIMQNRHTAGSALADEACRPYMPLCCSTSCAA